MLDKVYCIFVDNEMGGKSFIYIHNNETVNDDDFEEVCDYYNKSGYDYDLQSIDDGNDNGGD